jgi:hypothetical protein
MELSSSVSPAHEEAALPTGQAERYEEMLSIIRAAQKGRVIEMRDIDPSHIRGWVVMPPSMTFNFASWQYRVKPHAREWWLVKSNRGPVVATVRSLEAANNLIRNLGGEPGHTIIRVREVSEQGGEVLAQKAATPSQEKGEG